MKIAYLLLAHTDPRHFKNLIDAIHYQADIFVHVDAKSNLEDFRRLSLPENVYFLQERVSISWAGISMIDATLQLIKVALNHPENYSHLVLISGLDYPIKNPEFIYQTFIKNPKREFIKFIDMRESPTHYMKQIDTKTFIEPLWETSNKFLKMGEKGLRRASQMLKLKNHWNEQIVPYFGSQWWALTPNCCQYILDYLQEHPDYYQMNRQTFSPDEHFIHTLVGNSPFAENSTGLQKFEGRGTWRLANLHLIHHSLSKYYSLQDWDEIKASDKLFVRKVNSTVSQQLIEKLNQEVLASYYVV